VKQLKLCVFDLEGTVFNAAHFRLSSGKPARSAWTLLADRLGPEALEEDRANRLRWKAGGYRGYSAWVIDTIRLHRRHGLTKAVFDEVIGGIPYFPGVTETLAALRGKGMEVAVLSGGVKALADRVALDHGLEHCYAAAEYFWNEDGTIRHWNVMPTDFVSKRTVVDLLCHDLGISSDACAFVGDGENDRTVAAHVGLSCAFNPHAALREAVTHVIEQPAGREDLSQVLPILLGASGKSPNGFSVSSRKDLDTER
jgi:phosphoserine phosphatase